MIDRRKKEVSRCRCTAYEAKSPAVNTSVVLGQMFVNTANVLVGGTAGLEPYVR